MRLLITFMFVVFCLITLSCGQDSVSTSPAQRIDPGLMELLQTELDSQLRAQGGRGLSDITGVYVDTLSGAAVGSDCRLSWIYNNTGDYDQNSETNAADLTPIAINFGVSDSAVLWPFARVADGDGNGEVNLGDITPIATNFLSTVSNYVVECNVDGAGDWQPVANVAFGDGEVEVGSALLQFSCDVTNGATVPGTIPDQFRVAAGPEASPLYNITGPSWEVWLLSDINSGYAPLEVEFTVDFFGDVGPYDVVVDFDDGSPDYTGTSPDGTDLVFTHQFDSVGMHLVTGTATNTGPTGGLLPLTKEIIVDAYVGDPILNPSNWERVEMETGEMWGSHSSTALINGRPSMVFTRDDNKRVYYSRSTVANPTGIGDWVTVLVDGGANRGGTLDLVEWNGFPCVVYEDTVGQDIYFAIPDIAEPVDSTPWQIHEIDSMGLNSPQIANYLGVPVVVYITGSGIRYAASTAGTLTPPASNADWAIEDIDTDGFMTYPQVQTVGGEVLVAYQRADAGWKEVRYSWYDGVSWTMTVVDDLDKNSGSTVRMTLAGGMPILAYQNIDIVSYLRYATTPTITPVNNSDWTTITVRQEPQTHIGNWMGFAWYEGRPFMSYVNTGAGADPGLQVTYANTNTPAGPSDFDHALLLETAGFFVNQETNALVLADGSLALVYRTSEGLQFSYYNGP